MEILLADHAGFCFGVKRAVNIAQENLRKGLFPIYSFGPLIHNPQLVAKLEAEGLKVVDNPEQLEGGFLLIRSHGLGPKTVSKLAPKFKLIDATCPFVTKAQKLVREFYEKQYQIIIVGNKSHPEVQGLQEWAENKAVVIEKEEELTDLKFESKVAVVAQTTQERDLFNKIVSYIRSKAKEVVVCDTICPATKQRQAAALELAQKVDLMIVIGGKNSSNTKKLAEICRKSGTKTYHIESSTELKPSWFNNIDKVGVTAGASTPDWIIEEVLQKMTDLNQKLGHEREDRPQEANSNSKELDLELASETKEVKKGEIVEGKVVKIAGDEVIIDFGGKTEGIIPVSELSFRKVSDPSQLVKVGETVKVMVIKEENEEGQPVFSKKKADRMLAWEELKEAMDSKKELIAPVIEVVKGGVLVDVGIKGFVPASLLERGYVEDLNQYLGKNLRLRVIELDRSKNRVVLSQKAILDEEYERKKKELWESLKVGDVKKGIVKRITDFGAFVDLGGVEGLLHVSELAWDRVNHPSDVLKEGEEIEVKVIGLDKDKQKISLSRKELLPDPWATKVKKYKENEVVEGKVIKTVPFGAFVELEPGIEGLVHISQLANFRVAKTEDVVKSGDKVKVKILKIDEENKKISLSIKEAEKEPVSKNEDSVDNYQTSDLNLTLGDLFGDLFNKKENE